MHIGRDPCRTMLLALRLRHKKLFNDAFILALGPWSKPTFTVVWDLSFRSRNEQAEQLFQLLSAEQTRFKSRLADIRFQLLRKAGEGYGHYPQESPKGLEISKLVRESLSRSLEGVNFNLPRFFRRCLEEDVSPTSGNELNTLRYVLDSVLENNLKVCNKEAKAGKQEFLDYFFSFKVDSFPWDESQSDW